jgi:cob(I)alamin adenosyltransferase
MASASTNPHKIYTGKGDDGTTGLLYGGRVRKDDPVIAANGALDEAQAAIGAARAETAPGSELDQLLVEVERDLWILMAEIATAPANRAKLSQRVTEDLVRNIERHTDDLATRFPMPKEFVLPGQSRVGALLDLARTIVRRAERLVVALGALEQDTHAVPYLNRLSSLLWAAARWQEAGHTLRARPYE